MTAQVKLDTTLLDKIIEQTAGQKTRRWVVHDGVEYGVYQEFTERGHPSLTPAFERHTRDLPKIIGAAIGAGVGLDPVLAKIAFDIQADWAADVNVDTGAYKNSITAEPK